MRAQTEGGPCGWWRGCCWPRGDDGGGRCEVEGVVEPGHALVERAASRAISLSLSNRQCGGIHEANVPANGSLP